ncbi:MAG TPA: class I SAM-dependent methyltransferase [Dissulfurispiraceae bacterium]|nr:class I SAM-dependent methyltransferase [Dissulfurispiraceae bacterium]
MSELSDKWDRRYGDRPKNAGAASRVLTENAHLLPPKGTALDLACGLGANATFLAEIGLEVHAWDISSVAIETLRTHAEASGMPVNAAVRDVTRQPPEQESFDVVVVVHFLDRSLTEHLIAALRPGGVLFYQTFTHTKVNDVGPRNEEYLLSDNELLQMFGSLRILVYREEGRTGDTTCGFRNEAMLVACKS